MSDCKRGDGPVRIGRVLDEVLAACGLDARLSERAILASWPRIAGQRLAKHVRAVDLREGVLFLAAEHGSWRQEVTLLMPRIRNECNRRFGEGTIKEIRWAHGWTDEPCSVNDKRQSR